ncbi:hypothetical protein PHSY_000668 [Pseudozyma hubeiensis SY62]|uniref:BHLH domain-containing protein n=1 Tax=Pseudozyma hubeiensis (strain SY62) TaxID=1305764 RepID=R9NX28_PSEHS|nr:hypothetical protein PHSY_000668 [Pseudozyma hubeiensis SY62]GAC93106.1 hypothetical protein PHSY_000668 [Pseudozyma hubeiensis SY62]
MVGAKRKTLAGSISPSTTASQIDDGEPLLNKDGTRRKSRVLRRKTDHSIIERRRREKINEKLVALQSIVPACRKECQDLIEKKYVTPLRATDDNEADKNSTAIKRDAKRKREAERLDKAKNEMSEKVRTTMVLEKLCIISHTLDFVVRLQEENKALRALCDCQSERRTSINSTIELEEHYRSAHGNDAVEEGVELQEGERVPGSPSSSSEPNSIPSEEQERPSKRRLHWGSDEVRKASVRSEFCRHRCDVHSHDEARHRERSLSPTISELDCDTAKESKAWVSSASREAPRSALPCSATTSDAGPCSSFCRTQHSCCREEEQGSDTSTDGPDDPTSPPLDPTQRRVLAVGGQHSYFGRQKLPSFVNLGLPKLDAHFPTLRQDAFASLYRRDPPKSSELPAGRRPFRPLSLYTSHAPPSTLPHVNP